MFSNIKEFGTGYFPPPTLEGSLIYTGGVVRSADLHLHRYQVVQTAVSSAFDCTDPLSSTRSFHPAPRTWDLRTSPDRVSAALLLAHLTMPLSPYRCYFVPQPKMLPLAAFSGSDRTDPLSSTRSFHLASWTPHPRGSPDRVPPKFVCPWGLWLSRSHGPSLPRQCLQCIHARRLSSWRVHLKDL